jgi:hypothetical protein
LTSVFQAERSCILNRSVGIHAEIANKSLDSRGENIGCSGATSCGVPSTSRKLAARFSGTVEAGLVLVCDLVILEMTRLDPNERRAREVADRLAAFESIRCRPSFGLAPDRLNWRWRRAVITVEFRRRISCLPAQRKRLE